MVSNTILVVNPGSTSTKVAIYENNDLLFLKNIKHPLTELKKFKKVIDQYEFRKNVIMTELKEAHIELDKIVAIVGRGGLLKPIRSGVYSVNEKLKADLHKGVLGEHASNMGGLIADDIARTIPGAKAYIADPVVVDELNELARVAGHPNFERLSIFHALNQKAIARSHALSIGRIYEELNLIVVHMGGGISVGAHEKGNVIDVNQALDGEGPFSPERSGTLPVGQLVKLCFSGKYTEEEIIRMVTGEGGFVAYLGTNNAYEVEQMVNEGNEEAQYIQSALAYQVAKEIGAMGTVLKGEVDGILLTGGMAYNKSLVKEIKERVEHLGTVGVYPGEDEMKALSANAMMVLRGEIECLEYE